jgi:hypothetical protein
MFSQINLWIGAAGGAALISVLGFGYNTLIENPSIVRETTIAVEAEARERTVQAIMEVTDEAQRARAMRRYCLDGGKLYDFPTGQCR